MAEAGMSLLCIIRLASLGFGHAVNEKRRNGALLDRLTK